MPTMPAQAVSDFVRPDPFASDRIMDATARLLAPRPRTAAPKQEASGQARRKQQPSRGNTSPRKDASSTGKQDAPAKQNKPEPAKKKPAAQKETAPVSGGKKRSRTRHNSRPRPVELPRSRVKDSTEQPSLMKPYYLNDN